MISVGNYLCTSVGYVAIEKKLKEQRPGIQLQFSYDCYPVYNCSRDIAAYS